MDAPAVAAGRASTSVVRVRYAETDMMGVVYYANYLVWFEVARTDWLRTTGATYADMEAAGLRLPVIAAHCEYHLSARYDDEIEIRTTARRPSPARLAFDYEVIRRADQARVASGSTVHVAVDLAGRPVRLPSRVKELLA
ncbi:MAG: thioesterase family protein [Vicinamibacterales bacterium]|nr:thioesterase family protein [Vicinamibacterales bacterium]